MSKCDFCRDTIKAGGEPACVSACPTRALHFGEFDELRREAGEQKTMAPLPDPEFTTPNAVFGSHRMSQPFNDAIGFIANPEENKDA